MGLNRTAAKRDANEPEIVEALRRGGAKVERLSDHKIPDLLVGINGINILMEVKEKSGKLNPDQKEWHDEWTGQKVVVHSVEEALNILDSLVYCDSQILDPRNFSLSGNSNIPKWRQYLREKLIRKRNWQSDYSKESILRTGFDMHEAIIPRAVAPTNLYWAWMIHCEYNVLILTRQEHENPPDRKWAYAYLCEIYGKDIIDRWIDSLPWKVQPDKVWLP